ncbi:hypothetical protein CSIM01_13867 [Colletotrichum simmondsii]|uniref:Uncharacterized protein n=1 Tax=Colletotrichum simmondsii TaxID=703756 RepID=A0A135RXV4_9PEZI|nr:hypothetical protein CSIM01_13867 [Colletotrichum simmondsii]
MPSAPLLIQPYFGRSWDILLQIHAILIFFLAATHVNPPHTQHLLAFAFSSHFHPPSRHITKMNFTKQITPRAKKVNNDTATALDKIFCEMAASGLNEHKVASFVQKTLHSTFDRLDEDTATSDAVESLELDTDPGQVLSDNESPLANKGKSSGQTTPNKAFRVGFPAEGSDLKRKAPATDDHKRPSPKKLAKK